MKKSKRRWLKWTQRNRVASGYYEDGIGSLTARLSTLGFHNYAAYLASSHWIEVKQKFKDRACELCGSHDRLNIHHRTYERLGSERDADLIALCRICHYDIHQRERFGCKGGLEAALRRRIKQISKGGTAS